MCLEWATGYTFFLIDEKQCSFWIDFYLVSRYLYKNCKVPRSTIDTGISLFGSQASCPSLPFVVRNTPGILNVVNLRSHFIAIELLKLTRSTWYRSGNVVLCFTFSMLNVLLTRITNHNYDKSHDLWSMTSLRASKMVLRKMHNF